MIASRRAFLTTFFSSLEANGVRYCVLRNYENLYADTASDVDLLLSRYSLQRFQRCLRNAAEQTGFRLVQSARYVNYSHVFWQLGAGFIRIDFETDQRWRLFPVLTAREVLDRRRRHQEFFIPHPEDESAILFLAALWRGELSERYRRQLAALYAACPNPTDLRRTLVRAFGSAGGALAEFQPRATTDVFNQKLVKHVRRSLFLLTLGHGWRLVALVRNTVSDFIRLGQRLRRPAGISFLFVSSHERPRNFEALRERLDFLFPAKKCFIQSCNLAAQASARGRWSWRLRWLRFRTLFKGGLFLRAYHLANDTDLPRVMRAHARYLYPSRSFVCGEDSVGRLYFAHVGSGFMSSPDCQPSDASRGHKPGSAGVSPASGWVESGNAPAGRQRSQGQFRESPATGAAANDEEFGEGFIQFTSEILECSSTRVGAHREGRADLEVLTPCRGLFCALVGLDGSGKTTLARNLCDVSAAGGHFHGARYFHWRPKVFRRAEFPLPEFQNLPRKAPQDRTVWNALLSTGRLLKNAALVNLAWLIHVRPLLKRGYLVLVDRYFYNYHLDPVSVKYTGPAWLLARAEKWFPRPDAVITLSAPAELLLQRKQELSEVEIRTQAATLQRLQFSASCVIRGDATESPEIVAQKIMADLIAAQK